MVSAAGNIGFEATTVPPPPHAHAGGSSTLAVDILDVLKWPLTDPSHASERNRKRPFASAFLDPLVTQLAASPLAALGLEDMPAAEFYELLLRSTPPDLGPRGVENLDPVPDELTKRFPNLFVSTFIAGSASRQVEKWRELFPHDEDWTEQVEGIHWDWLDGLTAAKIAQEASRPNFKFESEEALSKMRLEIAEMLETGRISDVSDVKDDKQEVTRTLPIFMIQQSLEKWRLIYE